MAKIIKVGSQNPTFTSQKTSSINTHRSSNEATNPFKFTNFEGNTLQFADVFEGFKPSFKATPVNRLRMIASSAAGSVNKMKSGVESIVNFAKRVYANVTGTCSNAWAYAKNTNITDVPGIKQTKEFLLAERHLPSFEGITSRFSGIKEGVTSRIGILNRDVLDVTKEMASKWNGLISNISFNGKQKYANMSVAELEIHLAAALEEGGINE